MSISKNTTNIPEAERGKNLPDNVPAELAPVIDWWHENGSQFLITVCIVIIAFVAASFFVNRRNAKAEAASAAILTSDTVEALELAADQYGSAKAGPVIKAKLAKAYYDAGRYDDALKLYESLRKSSNAEVAAIAKIGAAEALEAKGDAAAAQTEYDAFLADNSGSWLATEAKIGKARCLALDGDKSAASAILADLVVEKRDTQWESTAKDLASTIRNFTELKAEPAAPSIMDLLGNQAETAPAEEAPAAEAVELPVEVTPAEEAPADEAPAAEAPATEEAAPAAEAPAEEAPAAEAAPAE